LIFWFKNEKIKDGSKSKNIKKVEKKLSILKMLPEERAKYEYFLGRLASERDMLETSKEEGREETEKKLKPIIELKEQALLNSAKAMLNAGMSVKQVCEITKLQEEIINTL
jgi:predicted transposase YdaD